MAQRFAPEAADYEAQERRAWSGLRPMRPDACPQVGATTVPGLYVNVGHGMYGWTLACATADAAAAAVCGTG